MNMTMCRLVFTKFKVFNFIIHSVTVNMVYNFFWFQKSTKIFFHNQSVFGNISSFLSKWMVWLKNHFISTIGYQPTPAAKKSTASFSFIGFPHFSCFFWTKKFISTFSRAILTTITPQLTRKDKKNPTTFTLAFNFTASPVWIFLSINIFVGLCEMSSHGFIIENSLRHVNV